MRGMALLLALTPAIAGAQNLDAMNSLARATELANILGSEQLCGLTLNQPGIEAWIASNVSKDDMSFAGNLQMMMAAQTYQQDGMTASAKVAHCAAVKQSATAAGLLK